ncbi:MAG: ClbS/DfsB family four-helix bundle protein [Chloroflexi bacterium]|nr:ClbS/DfsB family four-helix bundle protein [Chloroflexota bacterium]
MTKAELLRQLDQTHQAMLDLLKTVDPEQVVYEETGWRVKDLVAHVATWDAETLRSFHALRRNTSYTIPNFTDVDDFNAYAATARMDESMERIMSDWEATRSWMKIIFNAMGDEDFSAEMTYPSGRQGNARDLVEEIIDHEREHMEEIRAAAP